MTFLIKPPKRLRKRRSITSKTILDRLNAYLTENIDEPVEILCGFWEDQQSAITYQELRTGILNGMLNEEILRQWSEDYAVLVKQKFLPVWQRALTAGGKSQPVVSNLEFYFDTQTPELLDWISGRGAQLVTSSSIEQREAISSLLANKVRESHTVDELSRLIRPCIGLTERDSRATLRYYDNIVASIRLDHPKMKLSSVRQKALDAATKYAEKKHRARAFTIAQTEMAFAYNRGTDEGVRQAQQNNLIGVCEKRWITSGDDQVCSVCAALDGMQIDMDGNFDFQGRLLFAGQKMMPPAHPRCGCAVEYIEIEPPKSHQAENISDVSAESDTKTPVDITQEYFDYATPGNGTISYDDRYDAYRHKDEIDTAGWLHKTFGGDIRLLKEAKEVGVKTPDYEWNGKLWELKKVTTAKSADDALRRGLKQIRGNPGGIILDYGEHTVEFPELLKIMNSRFKRGPVSEADIMVLIQRMPMVLKYKK